MVSAEALLLPLTTKSTTLSKVTNRNQIGFVFFATFVSFVVHDVYQR